MKKQEEIETLVKKAYENLRNANSLEVKQILTSLARKCAEINSEDFPHFSNTPITDYNSRLREGQVEEVKQEEKTMVDKFHEYLKNTPKEQLQKDWDEVLMSYNDKTIKPALQPLPEEMHLNGLWIISYDNPHWKNGIKSANTSALNHREWWRDLKKGDKFMCEDGLRTYNGKYSCIDGGFFLYTIEEGDIGLNADYCSPYIDPTQSFRSKLTPEMQVEFDKLMEGAGK